MQQTIVKDSEQVTKAPNFLCIGAPKSGSTWLQMLLNSHPEVFIPEERNEIHFFDRDFSKGKNYYLNFFKKAKNEKAIGEITPHYIYIDNPEILKTIPSIKKMIVILRRPDHRLFSHYKFRIRVDNYKGSFVDFLKNYPEATEWGMYGKYLSNYLKHYEKSQFLFLVFEEATKNLEQTKKELADFLEIDPTKFPENAGVKSVNKGFIPKNKGLYKLAIKVSGIFLKLGFYRIRQFVKSSGSINRLLKREGTAEKIQISDHTKKEVLQLYQEDLKVLEKIFPKALDVWKLN